MLPWGEHDRAQWKAERTVHRSYHDEVVRRVDQLRERYVVAEYGRIENDGAPLPLLSIATRDWSTERPLVLVTGGVHGYETSGVLGALEFAEQHDPSTAEFLVAGSSERSHDSSVEPTEFDVLVAPCVSPWAYERVQRWNADAIDPNRSFRPGTTVEECAALMRLVDPFVDRVRLHIDLHETTDSDETEFRPALAARDGVDFEPDVIPDGFYLCGDQAAPELEFQAAIIKAVSAVTHIAPPDENGQIIGSDVVARGVILYPFREYGLGAGITNAPYRTLTEVYPDSPRTSPQECIAAQVAAVHAAIAFAMQPR
jgi:hypothetical protein